VISTIFYSACYSASWQALPNLLCQLFFKCI